jgi:hypothetical protein
MEIVGLDRASIDRQSVSDGGKTNSSPGRARHKPLKPLRREGRVFRRTCGLSCAFLRMTAGAEGTRLSLRPRFLEGKRSASLGRLAPRDRRCLSFGRLAGMIDRKKKSGDTKIQSLPEIVRAGRCFEVLMPVRPC